MNNQKKDNLTPEQRQKFDEAFRGFKKRLDVLPIPDLNDPKQWAEICTRLSAVNLQIEEEERLRAKANGRAMVTPVS